MVLTHLRAKEDWKGHVFYPKGSLSLSGETPEVKKM